MVSIQPFFPQAIFGEKSKQTGVPPRVLISPHRYIQGPGVLDQLGRYLSIVPSHRPLIILSEGGEKRFGERLQESLLSHNIEPTICIFAGECCLDELARLIDTIPSDGETVDAVIAVGGGKCLDAGKGIAFRLGVPVVIVPTIASTDAPCSAVAVMYSTEGVGIGPEFYPSSPALVVVDTAIISASPLRHLVAGMGDALATYYEALTCFNNPLARNMVGGRPTITALAIAKLSAETLFTQGVAAITAMEQNLIDESLEQIIEANTLLSGMGFESGGLAAAHGIAAGLTIIPVLHKKYLHGELVGFGLMVQLILEDNSEEAKKVAKFCSQIGLPINLRQLAVDAEQDQPLLKKAMEEAIASSLPDSEPFTVTADTLFIALCEANQLGLSVSKQCGDTAYEKLHQHN